MSLSGRGHPPQTDGQDIGEELDGIAPCVTNPTQANYTLDFCIFSKRVGGFLHKLHNMFNKTN